MIIAGVAKALADLTSDQRFADYWKFALEGRPQVYIQRLLDSSTTTSGYKVEDVQNAKYGQEGAALMLFRSYPRIPFWEQVNESIPFYTDTGRLHSYVDIPEAIEYGENFVVHREGPEATPYLPNVIVSGNPYIRPENCGFTPEMLQEKVLDADIRTIANNKMSWSGVKGAQNPLWREGFTFYALTPKGRHRVHPQWSAEDWHLAWDSNFGALYRRDKRTVGTVLQYRDAAAIQFPEAPSDPPPAFTMGEKGKKVVIYHWKSDWQFGPLQDVDEAYPNMYSDWYPYSGVEAGAMPEATDYPTKGSKEYLTAAAAGNPLADPRAQDSIGPVQKMQAQGFGTIEPHDVQDAQGQGAWKNGTWRIAISVPRRQGGFTFGPGTVIPLAIAIWDGSRNERNGQKAYSPWNSLSLKAEAPIAQPTPTPSPGQVVPKEEEEGFAGWLAPALGSFGGLLAAGLAALVGFRIWRSRQGENI